MPYSSSCGPIVAAGWSRLVARQIHSLKVGGSNPSPATTLHIVMKTIRMIQSVVAFALLTQCTTTSDGTKVFDPVKATAVVNVTVPSAVRIAVSKEPKSVQYFKLVSATIDLLTLGSSELSPDTLQKALADIGPDVLKTVEAQAAIDAVQALYAAFYADVIAQKLSERELINVLRAMSSAIRRGLPA